MDAGSIPATSTNIMKTINFLKCTAYAVSAFLLMFAAFVAICIIDANELSATEYKTNIETLPAFAQEPLRAGKWKSTPIVIVCEYAPVTKEAVDRGIKYWKSLGHYFYNTQYHYDPLDKCNNPEPYGYIIIKLVSKEVLADMEDDDLAVTHFFIENDTKAVTYAKVYFRNNPLERTLEHELGHALGYLHLDESGHMMHHSRTRGGWKSSGLKN